MEIILENTKIVAGKFTGVAKVVDDAGNVLENYPIAARSKDEFDNTLANLLASHAALPVEFSGITDGKYIVPEKTPEPEAPAPTPKEIKQTELQQKEFQLINAVEAAKREKEITQIAAENPDVAAKLAEYNDFKALITVIKK